MNIDGNAVPPKRRENFTFLLDFSALFIDIACGRQEAAQKAWRAIRVTHAAGETPLQRAHRGHRLLLCEGRHLQITTVIIATVSTTTTVYCKYCIRVLEVLYSSAGRLNIIHTSGGAKNSLECGSSIVEATIGGLARRNDVFLSASAPRTAQNRPRQWSHKQPNANAMSNPTNFPNPERPEEASNKLSLIHI